jgi:signal transduction histidine kinase
MGGIPSKAIATLDRLVNFFIPPSIASNRELRQRAHVFLISHILGPFIGNVVPIAIYIFDPSPGYDVVVLAGSITAFWIFPFLLKAGVPYNPLALASVENLIFCIFWSCYFYGGVTSPTLPWVLTIPLLAFFYLGSDRRLRLAVMTMFAVNIGIFGWLYLTSYADRDTLPAHAMQGLGLISTTAAAIYVAMMALYYAKILASQGELEAEMKEHLVTAAALRAATREAEQASVAKSGFLAKMSHELRTPLNAVIGYSQLLLEDAENEGDTANIVDLQKIHGAGQHLLQLINRILDLSRIEAGKMELYLEDVDLPRTIRSLIQQGQPMALANNNRVEFDVPAVIGRVVWDIGKFNDIFLQVYENAHKFTRNGLVKVSVRRERDAQDWISIAVRDTGIGIANEHLNRLFEKFSVVDDSSSSKYGGTGLGLALAQKMTELMGGTISVESEIGIGTCFCIHLPATVTAETVSKFDVEAPLVPAGPHGGLDHVGVEPTMA